LAAALLLAAVMSSASASATPAATASKACAASGLVVWAGEEPGGGAAGSVYYRIQLTNLAHHTCTIAGFPKVSAVNLKGKRIGAVATHSPGKKVGPVSLAQGETATAQLRIVEALNFSADECRPAWAAGVRVAIPGRHGAKVAPLAFRTCALRSAKTLAVGAVTATVGAS
jgi:hypothetical protein